MASTGKLVRESSSNYTSSFGDLYTKIIPHVAGLGVSTSLLQASMGSQRILWTVLGLLAHSMSLPCTYGHYYFGKTLKVLCLVLLLNGKYCYAQSTPIYLWSRYRCYMSDSFLPTARRRRKFSGVTLLVEKFQIEKRETRKESPETL